MLIGVAAPFTESSEPPWVILNEMVGPDNKPWPPSAPLRRRRRAAVPLPPSPPCRLTGEVCRTAATGTEALNPGMLPMRSDGTATAAGMPVPESTAIGAAESALAERTLMLMFRLGEESTTGSATPVLPFRLILVAAARAATVAARAI